MTGLLSDVPGGTLDTRRGGAGCLLFIGAELAQKEALSLQQSAISPESPTPKISPRSCAQKNKGTAQTTAGGASTPPCEHRVWRGPGLCYTGIVNPTTNETHHHFSLDSKQKVKYHHLIPRPMPDASVGSADAEVYANLGALGMSGYKCF